MSIVLTRAAATNFLQYPEISLPLDKQGNVFLSASSDYDDAKSNGNGKSSALSLVSFVLWEKLLRETKDVSRTVSFGAKQTESRLEGTIHGEEFWIERLRPVKGSPTIKASFAGSSRKPDAQKEINDLFGTFELAQNTRFLSQRKALGFLTGQDSDRRRMMEDLLKIGQWRVKQKVVEQNLTEFKERIRELEREYSDNEARLDRIIIESCHNQELASSDMRARRDLLESQLLVKLANRKEAKEKTQEAHDNYTLAEINWKTENTTLSQLQIQTTKAQQRINILQTEILSLEDAESKLKAGVCPTCMRPLEQHMSYADNILESKHQLTVAVDKKEEAQREYNDLAPKVSTLHTNKQNAYGVYVSLQNDFNTLDRECESLHAAVTKLEQDILKTVEASASYKLEEMVELRQVMQAKRAAIDEAQFHLPYMEYFTEAFGSKGIPAMRIAQSLPILSSYLNNYLVVLSDNGLVMDILPFDTAKTNGHILERLTFIVSKRGQNLYMHECSVGEQQRVVISLFVALSKMQSILTGVSWNVRFIDELFDGLDDLGVQRVMQLLGDTTDVTTTICSSHRSSLKELDGWDKHWKVVSSGNKSKLLVA